VAGAAGESDVKFLVLYLLFLKATATTFAGLASLPEIRSELVVQRHMLTDEQLNASVVITRSTPGPVGVYVVSVGYFAAGITGAVAGWLAMSTPALVVIFLMSYVGKRARHPRVQGLLRTVVLASAALLASAAIPLAHDAIRGPLTLAIGILSLLVLLSKKVETLWVIFGAAAISLIASFTGLLS
jgi:chromate transporter